MGTFDLVLRFSFSSGNGVWRYCASVFKTDAPFSVIAYSANPDGLFATLTNVRVVDESGAAYLTANRRGTIIKERLLPLDAERYRGGDLSLAHLIDKYLAFMAE